VDNKSSISGLLFGSLLSVTKHGKTETAFKLRREDSCKAAVCWTKSGISVLLFGTLLSVTKHGKTETAFKLRREGSCFAAKMVV
jgi:hypothetical protein